MTATQRTIQIFYADKGFDVCLFREGSVIKTMLNN